MAKSRKDCIDEIRARSGGRSRAETEELLGRIDERAQRYQEDGAPAGEAYARARDDILREEKEQAALGKRDAILDLQRSAERRRFYRQTAAEIAGLPARAGAVERWSGKAPRLALEAKMVGVELPFEAHGESTGNKRLGWEEILAGGLVRDLRRAGLFKIFVARELQNEWAKELFELNKRPTDLWQRAKDGGDATAHDLYELTARGQGPGNPGLTKNAQALEIAKIIHGKQKFAIAAENAEGAWVRDYNGYITRTSHSPYKIHKAGVEQWVADAEREVDRYRFVGGKDPARVRTALRELFTPLVSGDHFDYSKPLEQPIYPNVAAKISAHRAIPFKDADAWLRYNKKYGLHDPTETVLDSLRQAARRISMMSDWGSKPQENFEADLAVMKAEIQARSKAAAGRYDALAEAARSPAADAKAKAKVEADMAASKDELDLAAAQLKDLNAHERMLRNEFAQISGEAARPVHKLRADALAGWMAWQRVSKLGRVFFTHFESLMTKAMEGRYWGATAAERYAGLFGDFSRGAEGSAKREAADLALGGFESELGQNLARYDVADAPRGVIAKLESYFWPLTFISKLTDNQRNGFQRMAANLIGRQRGSAFDKLTPQVRRVLRRFGVGPLEWDAFHKVEWSDVGGRRYLFPSDVLALSDADVAAYLQAARPGDFRARAPDAQDIVKGRNDLALGLAMAYADRANTAVPLPNDRTRARVMMGSRPGESLNMALRLILQFKMWSIDMAARQWGREIYGRIGDARYDRVAGLVEFLAGSLAFGMVGEGLRQLTEGKDPIAQLRDHPVAFAANGLMRSGFGLLFGDFLLGEYDRHGFSAVAQLAGPTVAQIDDLMNVLHGKTAREKFASAIKMVRTNTPFANLWFTYLAMNTLVWHRLQEWINPGYLQRSEQRQKQQSGTEFWLSPAKTDQWITGRRTSPF